MYTSFMILSWILSLKLIILFSKFSFRIDCYINITYIIFNTLLNITVFYFWHSPDNSILKSEST